MTNDRNVHIRVVQGEINGNEPVDNADITVVSDQWFKSVDGSNYKCDLNTDGFINILDVYTLKSNLGNSASCE